jgi:hypothetical protein
VIADGTYVYWIVADYVTNDCIHIIRCPVGGCGSSPVDIANFGGCADGTGLAADAQAVYWSTNQGKVFRIAK